MSEANEQRRFSSDQIDVYPFSLCCVYCDDGMQIDSEDEAVRSGWTGIQFDAGGLGHNYIGLCPSCRAIATKMG